MNIYKNCLFVTALCMAIPLFAQQSDPTVEELYLQSSIKARIIRVEATSPDIEMKKVALNDIAEMVEKGNISDKPEIVDILIYLAQESVTNITREQGRILYDFPEIRRDAVRMLGEIGSDRAEQTLVEVIVSDPEVMVISEAILAISKIDVKNVKARNQALQVALFRQTARKKDSNLAYTYLIAVENIIKREGKITDIYVIEELAKVADARQGYNVAVREKAYQVLKSLQNL